MTRFAITQFTPQDNRISLSIGQPDPDLLPARLFRHMSADAISLAYGNVAGDGRFRECLAEWLGRQYGQPVETESLMVTNGSSNALDMICTRYTRPGDTVLVEDPTYFIARRQLLDHDLKIVAVPMDDGGVDVEELERQIETHRPAFFYTVPVFHNPTGRTLIKERRLKLLDVAKRLGCTVVADEVYQLLYYGNRPPEPLACLDEEAPVLSIGSFSKILAPGLRLGWIQAGKVQLARLEKSPLLAGGGGLAPFTSTLVRPLIANGNLDEHLAGLKSIYCNRLAVLADHLERELAGRIEFVPPDGGYFIWVRFKDGTDTGKRLPAAVEAGVDFLPGREFSDSPEKATAMRLCFAYYHEDRLREACIRLGRVFA